MFALIGCVVYSLIAMLFGMGISNILYSCIVIIVFMGLTAFDVQKIKKFYYGFEGDEDMLHKCSYYQRSTALFRLYQHILKRTSSFRKKEQLILSETLNISEFIISTTY